ncbi:MAG: hypothetical protein R3E62_09510 [Pseudomonadales bacterium]|jgi:FtsH-binding integral membrane protein
MSTEFIIQAAGTIPAIIFPTASAIQLYAMLLRRSAEGVSAISWFFFGVANICLYIYTQKYSEWASIASFLGTSVLNFSVCGLALYYRKKARSKPR